MLVEVQVTEVVKLLVETHNLVVELLQLIDVLVQLHKLYHKVQLLEQQTEVAEVHLILLVVKV